MAALLMHQTCLHFPKESAWGDLSCFAAHPFEPSLYLCYDTLVKIFFMNRMITLDQFFQMLDLQLTFLLNIFIGVFAYRMKMITDENRSQFISIILNILLPAMVFNSFKNLTPDLLKSGLWVLLASTLIYIGSYVIGAFAFRDLDDKQQRIMHYATLVNNAGFAGQPLSASMYGDVGTIFSSIYLVPHRIFMWTAGISILSDDDHQSNKGVFYKFLRNPSIIALVLGIIRGLLQIPIPAFINRSIGQLAAMVSPFAAITIGSIIATISLKSLFEKGVLRYVIIRLLAIPVAVLSISKWIGLDETLIGVLTIMSSMPAGTTTALLADSYDLDVQLSSKIVFISTIISIITVPFLMLFI